MKLLEFLNAINERGIVDDRLRAWMGNSKVVDHNGDPLPVYHGTRSEREFDTLRGMSHFGTLDAASSFLPPFADGPPSRIFPVYLRIENPLEIRDEGDPHDDYEYTHAAAQALDREGKYDAAVPLVAASLGLGWNDDVLWKYYNYSPKLIEKMQSIPIEQIRAASDRFNNMSWEARQEYYASYLEKLGYDGFVYTNEVEDEGTRSWVPFRSNQIRYAYSESRLDEVDIGRTLYHGTTKERAREIEWDGLEPRVGELVMMAYGDYEDEDDMDVYLRLVPLGFAADKQNFNKVMSAMTYHISEMLAKTSPERGSFPAVSDDDIFQHGAILVFQEGEYDFTHRSEADEQWHDDYDFTEHPRQVEPGDWYTDWRVKPSYVLTGRPMIRLLKRMGQWPRRYTAKNPTERETKSIMGDAIRMAINAFPDKPKEEIINAVKNMSFKDVWNMYTRLRQSANLRQELAAESVQKTVIEGSIDAMMETAADEAATMLIEELKTNAYDTANEIFNLIAYDNSYIDDSMKRPSHDKDFQLWVERYANEQVNEAAYRIETNLRFDEQGNIMMYRALTAFQDWPERITEQPIGNYWSWEKQAAEPHWGGPGDTTWLVIGSVDPWAVDWAQTLFHNAHPNYDEEKEIYIPSGTPVTLQGIETDSGRPIDPSRYQKGQILKAGEGQPSCVSYNFWKPYD